MAFNLLVWHCRPVGKAADSTSGAYTTCAVGSRVISVSNFVLWCLCIYRMWLMKKNLKVRRYHLSSNCYNYLLGLLSGCCTAEPLLRFVMDISIFNLDGETSLAPFQTVSLIIEAFAWCSRLIMIGLGTKLHIREFRPYVRFGIIYVLAGDAVILNLILQ
ncbi:ABC transporter C family member 2 [Melia azedarach]|uniref:ABC transporter C family member 2 n=3 Tax=Melia azedarach TaxID=155640 RepID=A0ACC1WVV0_MELAZ|nr:ABC transporter C family member 2 [Melia azedarach]KAJ4703045.1 ABC transporter C family member 2 [Melia azedarach]KAJ4703046.1 ABC transporter C family member 2 [Melia azedarach]